MSPQRPVSIFITPFAFQKLKLYIELCPAEISGLGVVEPSGDQFIVTDVFILPQRVTASDTELNPEHLCDFLSHYIAQGRDPASLRVWWHSHGENDLYWSVTDHDTIEAFPGEYIISIVGNKKGEFLCRLDVSSPSREAFEGLNLVPLEEQRMESPYDLETLRQTIQREIREMVKRVLPLALGPEMHEGVFGFPKEYQEEYLVELDFNSLKPPKD